MCGEGLVNEQLKYRGYLHFWKRSRDLHSDLSVRSKTQNGFEYVIFINHNDCHGLGTPLCCISLGPSAPESEWALRRNGCVGSKKAGAVVLA